MATINTLPAGLKLADRYEIIRPIGQGGMGVVYLAHDTMLDGVPRAIKTIRPELLQDPKASSKLKKEAVASMTLAHPNVVKVFNYDEWQANAFIVMEYIDGQSLNYFLSKQEKLNEDEFLHLASQILEGIKHSHDSNILHQDIKPANIFVTNDNTIKIADFGIAKVLNDTATRLTGQVNSGTLIYMSPEMLRGKKPCLASDIYSIGITFYEMLAGDPPFNSGDITWQHLKEDPEPLEGISTRLNTSILRALEKEATDRYSSCKEFLDSLTIDIEPEVSHSKPNPIQISKVSPSKPTPVQISEQTKAAPPAESSKKGGELYSLAKAAMLNKNWEAAEKLLISALDLDPELKIAISPELSYCRKRRDETGKKEEEMARIPAYFDMSQRFKEKGKWNAAEEYLRKVLDVDPENEDAKNGIADINKLRSEAKSKPKLKKSKKVTLNPLINEKNLPKETGWFFRIIKTSSLIIAAIWFLSLIFLGINNWLQEEKQRNDEKHDKQCFVEGKSVRETLKVFSIPPLDYKLEMVKIPAGSFMMGERVGGAYPPEIKNNHKVTISRPFYISKFECTESLWSLVMGGLTYETPIGREPEDPELHYPVVNVSWNEATQFCEKLSDLTGDTYRLPTEAEWEYACRAGTRTDYFWGNSSDESDQYAWTRDNSGMNIHPVGQKLPNPWGLYDITGNVSEWCQDEYEEYSSQDAIDPIIKNGSESYIYRGGSYTFNTWDDARSNSRRAESEKNSRLRYVGFRIVKEIN